ncbi:hypothetical protein ACQPYK_08650 [Streptosporangium sp. CA-135522]|uniref:hypothetical protein n=1 Tax=Streptosporangium sp. CA-135522 TaxID=3240072 RepID=UPI003D91D798
MTEHFIDRPLVLGRCTRCGAWILAGHNAGLRVLVDLDHLDAAAELLALAAGRHTYNLLTLRRAVWAEWRCSFRIAAPRRHPVVASHPCWQRGFTPMPAVSAPESPVEATDERIPF